ncbi:hypothetical protein ACFORO_36805 [Amycolatopsis halotolerans]|uniref:PE family protein n=2 Tax=Amycolatopsis halotolerans TaxID=330083 RepID=A0ABV7QRS0_9PSEU
MDQPAANAGRNWLPDFTITITDGTGTPPGPGFTISRDDARSMLKLAKQARKQFGDMRAAALSLLRLTAPADDVASNAYQAKLLGNEPATGAFGAGIANVQHLHAYSNELVLRLEEALRTTENSEESAADSVKNAASGKNVTGLAG